MNPDNHKTAQSITWTLKDSNGNVVSFRVFDNNVIFKDHNRSFDSEGVTVRHISKNTARKVWKDCIGKGFEIQNKCVDHDMQKFYDMKRKKEKDEPYSTPLPKHVDDYLKEYMSYENIHNNDLQEMRINPKKLYTDNWDTRYALEA